MWSIPHGSGIWSPVLPIPEWASFRRRRIHRDGDRSRIHAAMNAEYAGFFDVGMVERKRGQRHHRARHHVPESGRTALEAAGGWSSDTICEDSDLGLTIMELGWRAHYTPTAGMAGDCCRRIIMAFRTPALALGRRRGADHQEALAPVPARAPACSTAIRKREFARSAG